LAQAAAGDVMEHNEIMDVLEREDASVFSAESIDRDLVTGTQ
jgi:hypothetical protein